MTRAPTSPTSTMMLGYISENSHPVSADTQFNALVEAGVDAARIYRDDVLNSSPFMRSGLTALLEYARSGDTVVVTGLDRLGRSHDEVLATTRSLIERGIGLRTLREGVDTAEPTGALVVGVLSALAFDADPSRSGTAGSGFGRAVTPRNRRHTTPSGRPRALNAEQVHLAERMRANGNPVPTIADTLGVSRATLYRTLARKRGEQ